MSSRTIFDPLLSGEIRTLQFDFTSDLAVGETISTQVTTATTYSGTDASASSLISGAASASGAVVSQKVSAVGRPVGTMYELLCTITTSLGQTIQQSGFLAIVPDLV